MKTYFVNIYCNGILNVVAVEATCLIEAQRKAISAQRSILAFKRGLMKADKQNLERLSFSN